MKGRVTLQRIEMLLIMEFNKSEKVFKELCKIVPGGVNSPFRGFGQVGGFPPIIQRGLGSRVFDIDGNEYIDLCCGWGPLLFGHSHPKIIEAVKEAALKGTLFGASTEGELKAASMVQKAFPSMEMLRFVNSGAEAVNSALRVARSVTMRPRIMKFEGCYHGHVECLDSAGQEATEAGGPLPLGSSPGSASETVVAKFNDLDSAAKLFAAYPGQIAAAIIEPVTGSMGVIAPDPGFLEGLKELCHANGALFILDEVLTGFRVALGGAQERFKISADLTCLGKALSGGLAMGAYGGKAEYVKHVSPTGPIYQAGTYCGNPISVAGAIAELELAFQEGVYERLEALSERLVSGLKQIGGMVVQNVGSMFFIGFGPERVHDYEDCLKLDLETFAVFFHKLLNKGVYLPPSTTDAACISAVHTEEDIDKALEAVSQVIKEMGLN